MLIAFAELENGTRWPRFFSLSYLRNSSSQLFFISIIVHYLPCVNHVYKHIPYPGGENITGPDFFLHFAI